MNLRNISWAMGLVLLGSVAMPSLARKKKVQPVLKPAVQEDHLSPNDRQRYNYFFLEGARQQAAGNYSAAFDLFEHARKIDPKAAETYFYESLFYSQLKQDSLALAYMQKAIELNPENQTYAEQLGRYYIGSQKYDLAIDAYENLYAKNHDNTDALRILVQLYSQNKDYKSVLKTISRLEVEEGESEQFTLSKMRVYELMNDKKAAYQELKSLVDQHPLDMQYKTMLGNWLVQHDRQKEAYKCFTDVLKEEPDNSYAQMSLYDYYNATHQEQLAGQMLDKILMSPKSDLETKVMMYRSFIQKNESEGGDSTKVIALFDKALNVAHPSADVAEMKAAYMSLKKMPADSVCRAFEKVLTIAPDNVNARMQLVQMLWNEKKYDLVSLQCKAAQEYNPEEMVFYYFGGMAYYQKNKEDEALREFRLGLAQVNAQSPADLVSDLYAVTGDILHKKGEEQEAFAAYDSCLQWKDDNVMALNNYAYYLSEKGVDLHKAEAMSYKTIKAEPNNGTYLDTYAWILFMEERYADAKTYIDQALKNRDSTADNSTVIEHAGDIYYMNGMADESVDFWKKAYTGENQTEVLAWKIKNRQYITEEELKKRNASKQKPAATKKSVRKGKKTEVSHVVQVRAEGPKAPEAARPEGPKVPEAARPERAEAPSPGQRPGYNSNQQGAL